LLVWLISALLTKRSGIRARTPDLIGGHAPPVTGISNPDPFYKLMETDRGR